MMRNFFLCFIKIHILHHANQKPFYGLWLIEELRKHGYKLSPGTLYPILHSLEEENYLDCVKKIINGKVRKYYKITTNGKNMLTQSKNQIKELIRELKIQL